MHSLLSTFVSIWGYDLTYLELLAVLTSLYGVWLGTTGTVWTWPWWAVSSALYAVLFWKWDLISPNHWHDLDVMQGSSLQALMRILERVRVPMPSGKDDFSRKNADGRDISLFIPLILRQIGRASCRERV